MKNVRITVPNGNWMKAEITIDGLPIEHADSICLRMEAGRVPVLTMSLQPVSIEYEGETTIICSYSNPVTGEAFTHDVSLPMKPT